MCINSKGTCRITRIKHIVKFKYSIKNVIFFLLKLFYQEQQYSNKSRLGGN